MTEALRAQKGSRPRMFPLLLADDARGVLALLTSNGFELTLERVANGTRELESMLALGERKVVGCQRTSYTAAETLSEIIAGTSL